MIEMTILSFNLNTWLETFLDNAGIWGPVLSTILIFLEGILFFLPLVVFITVNVMTIGPVLGCLISWIFTVLGSYATFWIFRKGFHTKFQKRAKTGKFSKKVNNFISKLKFSQIVLVLACGFTPTFFINASAGLSDIPSNKYLLALITGKIFEVIFWAYVGTSIVECLTNPIKLIEVIILCLVAWLMAKYLNKKFDIDERF